MNNFTKSHVKNKHSHVQNKSHRISTRAFMLYLSFKICRAFVNTRLLVHKHVKISVDEWIVGNHSSTKKCQIFRTIYSINFQSQNIKISLKTPTLNEVSEDCMFSPAPVNPRASRALRSLPWSPSCHYGVSLSHTFAYCHGDSRCGNE